MTPYKGTRQLFLYFFKSNLAEKNILTCVKNKSYYMTVLIVSYMWHIVLFIGNRVWFLLVTFGLYSHSFIFVLLPWPEPWLWPFFTCVYRRSHSFINVNDRSSTWLIVPRRDWSFITVTHRNLSSPKLYFTEIDIFKKLITEKFTG